jgi:hypothetical protein
VFVELRNVSSDVKISLPKGSYLSRALIEYKTANPVNRKAE